MPLLAGIPSAFARNPGFHTDFISSFAPVFKVTKYSPVQPRFLSHLTTPFHSWLPLPATPGFLPPAGPGGSVHARNPADSTPRIRSILSPDRTASQVPPPPDPSLPADGPLSSRPAPSQTTVPNVRRTGSPLPPVARDNRFCASRSVLRRAADGCPASRTLCPTRKPSLLRTKIFLDFFQKGGCIPPGPVL